MKALFMTLITSIMFFLSGFANLNANLPSSSQQNNSTSYNTTVTAYADATSPSTDYSQTTSTLYARANSRTSYFFTQKDVSTSIFAVPYTYCVQVIRQDSDWYYVKYADDVGLYRSLYGYCRTADFDLLSQTPDVIYLTKTISVTYTAEESSITLPVLNQLTVDAAFYGTYYSGATAYSYVLCQGSFGYISGANDDYPLNIIETTEPSDTPEEDTTDTPTTTTLAPIIIALALIVTTILTLALLTHHKTTL
jgi:hypothetical protein